MQKRSNTFDPQLVLQNLVEAFNDSLSQKNLDVFIQARKR